MSTERPRLESDGLQLSPSFIQRSNGKFEGLAGEATPTPHRFLHLSRLS